MKQLRKILIVVERGAMPHHALRKGCILARHFGAQLELFLCDAEHAYALRRAYDSSGVREARAACLADAGVYLDALRMSVGAAGIDIQIDAACESPLHEGIVHKVLRSRPDLVVKSLGAFLTAADWHLLRTCPVPLMFARERTWHAQPAFAAAIDVSGEETPGLARSIVHTTEFLSLGCSGRLEMFYGARSRGGSEARTALAELATEFRIPPERVHLLEGEPTRTLPRFAGERDYDVIVMGALTHHQAITALVGTLAGRLVDSLSCDLVFIKPASFACPIGAGELASEAGYGDAPQSERGKVREGVRA